MVLQPETEVENDILQDLGGGLVLRTGRVEDADALSEFDALVHGNTDTGEPDKRVGVWVRDLLVKPHPTFTPDLFTIVEDTNEEKIVSSLNLIPQTWTYEGIPFGVGRPELVGTLPEYRHRGLIRKQFEVVHEWSRARGHLLQAITGIPYYYRQFGYEMAMDLGGGRTGYAQHVPELKSGEEESYRFRRATVDDVPLLMHLYSQQADRSPLHCQLDDALWRYEIEGKSKTNVNRFDWWIIESADGDPAGYLATSIQLWHLNAAGLIAFELKPEVSYAQATPSVLRFLLQQGAEIARQEGKDEPVAAFTLSLGAEHPVYSVIRRTAPRTYKPYAWYLRVPDLPAFLQRIAPGLEVRLAGSPLHGHTGELKLTFYRREGLYFKFEDGRLVECSSWEPEPKWDSGDAGFPGLTFLQLLFGYRSMEELDYEFADCWVDSDTAWGLLDALFPKQHAVVFPVS